MRPSLFFKLLKCSFNIGLVLQSLFVALGEACDLRHASQSCLAIASFANSLPTTVERRWNKIAYESPDQLLRAEFFSDQVLLTQMYVTDIIFQIILINLTHLIGWIINHLLLAFASCFTWILIYTLGFFSDFFFFFFFSPCLVVFVP